MRPMAVIAAAVWLCAMAGEALAQNQWKEFISKEDRFGANFPGDPVVTPITWTSEHGAVVPARVYAVTNGGSKYSMTVIDYNLVKSQLMEKVKSCPAGLERCLGRTAFSGDGYWKNDLRGAMIYAAFQYMKKGFKIDHYMWNHLGMGIEVNELQMTNPADNSRTFATIYMHHNVLYVMDATVPAGAPPPGLFTQSISLYEADGSRTSHGKVIFNGAELDPNEVYVGRGGQQGATQ